MVVVRWTGGKSHSDSVQSPDKKGEDKVENEAGLSRAKLLLLAYYCRLTRFPSLFDLRWTVAG